MAASGSVERSHGNMPVASVESQRWALPRTRHRHVEANFNSAAFCKRIPQREAAILGRREPGGRQSTAVASRDERAWAGDARIHAKADSMN
jgi:hypothetical protein